MGGQRLCDGWHKDATGAWRYYRDGEAVGYVGTTTTGDWIVTAHPTPDSGIRKYTRTPEEGKQIVERALKREG